MSKPEQAIQLLPANAYFSGEWHEREQTELFPRSWAWAGMLSDFAAPGDYRTVQVGNCPLIVLRNHQDDLVAFHNVCRHRGMQLLEGAGNTVTGIRCPYHFWTYDLTGGLRGMPREKELFAGLDRSTRSLRPASVGVLDQMVFVNPQAEPEEPFDAWLAEAPQNLWPHNLTNLAETGAVRYEIGCNWKVFVENAIDAYHLSYLHAATLGGPDALDMDWLAAGRHWIFIGKGSDTPQRTQSNLPLIPEFDATAGGPMVWWFFPNVGVLATSVFWSAIEVIPAGAERCYVDLRNWISAEPGAEEGYKSLFPGTGGKPSVGENVLLRDLVGHPLESGDFMIEDMWVCEKIQRNLHSPAYKVDRLAENAESSITFFQRNLLDFVPAPG